MDMHLLPNMAQSCRRLAAWTPERTVATMNLVATNDRIDHSWLSEDDILAIAPLLLDHEPSDDEIRAFVLGLGARAAFAIAGVSGIRQQVARTAWYLQARRVAELRGRRREG